MRFHDQNQLLFRLNLPLVDHWPLTETLVGDVKNTPPRLKSTQSENKSTVLTSVPRMRASHKKTKLFVFRKRVQCIVNVIF